MNKQTLKKGNSLDKAMLFINDEVQSLIDKRSKEKDNQRGCRPPSEDEERIFKVRDEVFEIHVKKLHDLQKQMQEEFEKL